MKRSERRQKTIAASAAKTQRTDRRGRMIYHSVKSSTICAIGYVDEARCLGIMYGKPGDRELVVYHYSDVPRATFDELMHASRMGRSVGAAVAALVKKPGYAFRKLERSEWAGVKNKPAASVADLDFATVETRTVAWMQNNERRARELVVRAAHFGHEGALRGDDWGATRVKLLLCLGEKYQDAVRAKGEPPFVKIVSAGARQPTPEEYVREAMLLERERCARLVDAEIKDMLDAMSQSVVLSGEMIISPTSLAVPADVSALQRVAAAIRLGDPTREMEP